MIFKDEDNCGDDGDGDDDDDGDNNTDSIYHIDVPVQDGLKMGVFSQPHQQTLIEQLEYTTHELAGSMAIEILYHE